MAVNQTGIAIVIRAFLPTGKTLDEQFTALSLVKTAHETGDYSDVLKAANIDEVKAEQKTRRVEDQPQEPAASGSGDTAGAGPLTSQPPTQADLDQIAAAGPGPVVVVGDAADDKEIPSFLKEDDKRTRKSKAA